MSASYVQKAQAHGSGVTSITTVGMNTTTGNTVAVSVGSGPDFTSLTDNGTSNTVTAVGIDTYNPGTGELDLTVKCLQNINGKTGHTFTANFSASDFVSMTASELTGVAASSLDTGSVATGHDLTSPYTLASNAFAQADEIVLLFNEGYCSGVSTYAESTGFTSIGGEADNNNYCGNWNWYKNIAATTALTPSLTDSTGTGYVAMLMVVAGFKSAAAGGTSVNPGVGALALTGYAPSISQPHAVLPGAGSISFSGFAPAVVQNTNVLPSAGTLAITGYAPTVARTANQAVAPGVGSLALTGYAPTIAQPQTASPGVGALTITGYAPTITQAVVVLPGAGTIAFTGYAPGLVQTANQALTAGVGSLVITGYAPSVSQASASPSLIPDPGVLTIVGYAPTVSQGGGGDAWGREKKKRRAQVQAEVNARNLEIIKAELAQEAVEVIEVEAYDDDEEVLMLML